MPHVVTCRARLSRRTFLKGLTAAHALVVVGLPPLVSMFNSHGTAYAADVAAKRTLAGAIDKRYVLWFNGNGIPERYWIPTRDGADYDLTPCLAPIAKLRDDTLVLSGLDNTFGGNGHPQALSALMTCTPLTGNTPAGPSVDQLIARNIGNNSRFRSLQIGVSQESFGGVVQKNMTWAGANRPLPPEEIPQKIPSFEARSRAASRASVSVTVTSSSKPSRFRTAGMKSGVQPWIL